MKGEWRGGGGGLFLAGLEENSSARPAGGYGVVVG